MVGSAGTGLPLLCLTPSLREGGGGGLRPIRGWGRAEGRLGSGGTTTHRAAGPLPAAAVVGDPLAFPLGWCGAAVPLGAAGRRPGPSPLPVRASRLPPPSVRPSIRRAASPRRAERPRFVQSHSPPEGPPAQGRGRRRSRAARSGDRGGLPRLSLGGPFIRGEGSRFFSLA